MKICTKIKHKTAVPPKQTTSPRGWRRHSRWRNRTASPRQHHSWWPRWWDTRNPASAARCTHTERHTRVHTQHPAEFGMCSLMMITCPTHTWPLYCPVTSCRFRPFRSVTVNGSCTLSSSSPGDNRHTHTHYRLYTGSGVYTKRKEKILHTLY